MAITMNQFKCSNGHSFEANAKLRTRCPHCGVSTKRSFASVVADVVDDKPDVTPDVKPDVTPEVKPAKRVGPVLVRQGRPRMAVKKAVATSKLPDKKKPKFRPVGAKVSAGLVKSTTIKKRGVMPTISRRPVKTAVARGIQGHEQVKPYWHDVADKFGF